LPTVSAGTLFAGDTLSGGSFAFTDKNVGSGNKTVTVSGVTVNDGNSGGNYKLSLVDNTTSSITQRALSFTPGDVTKTYDGKTSLATLGTPVFANVIGADAANLNLSSGTGNFDTRHAGTGKLVNYTGLGLGGTAAGNYSLAATTATGVGSIAPLGSVTWSGGASGNWSTPTNWAGDALPDRSNVGAVTIPAGSTVTYDGAVDAGTTLASLTVGGGLVMAGSTLAISGALTTPNYTQTGGRLAGTGTVNVSNNFSKSGGSLASTLTQISINHTGGNLVFSNPEPLNLGAVTANGTIDIETTGGIFTGSGTVKSTTANVRLATRSPLVIGSGGVEAVTGVTLEAITADAASTVTLNGGITAPTGAVTVASYGNVQQNASVTASNVGFTSTAGSINVGSTAVTTASKIEYKATQGAITASTSNFSGSTPTLTASVTPPVIDPCVINPMATGCPAAVAAAAAAEEARAAAAAAVQAAAAAATKAAADASAAASKAAADAVAPQSARTQSAMTQTLSSVVPTLPQATPPAAPPATAATASADGSAPGAPAGSSPSPTTSTTGNTAATGPSEGDGTTKDKPVAKAVVTTITVANATVQRPADQVVQIEKPKGKVLTCKR
ncbi:MAG: hypothetical protein K9K38_01500, partial [Rhodoferax sp.]|nr:hypothetical protein [Rhodoferax sp.]